MTMESMLAIDSVLRENQLQNEGINREGWWQTPPTAQPSPRAKLAGILVALAVRLSPTEPEAGLTARTTTPCVQA